MLAYGVTHGRTLVTTLSPDPRLLSTTQNFYHNDRYMSPLLPSLQDSICLTLYLNSNSYTILPLYPIFFIHHNPPPPHHLIHMAPGSPPSAEPFPSMHDSTVCPRFPILVALSVGRVLIMVYCCLCPYQCIHI